MHLNKIFGGFEHLVRPFRDTIVTFYLATGALWHIWLGVQSGRWQDFAAAAAALLLVSLGYFGLLWRRKDYLRLVEFAIRFPEIHPQEFFSYLLCLSGVVRYRLPNNPFFTINPANMDFRCGRKKGAVGPYSLLIGVWSTVWITRLALMSLKFKGVEFLKCSASALSVILATRMIWLARARVVVENVDRIPNTGPFIYLFTHSSFLDFVLVPLVLASSMSTRSNFMPSFLLAKDHFRDNWLFYRFFGIGRVAEALQMIFVDRKSKDKKTSARDVSLKAVDKLLNDKSDLTIFPQGTRAVPFLGANGEYLGAGYYTVGSKNRIKRDGGHLKKGAAHIAADAAIELSKSEPNGEINLIPVAIDGAAKACPRGRMKIKPNVTIRLSVGNIIKVKAPPNLEYSRFVDELHVRIDDELKTAAHIHAELERRFFEDARKMADPINIEEIALAIKSWRGDDYLVHAILDAIYACPYKRRREFLLNLIHLLLEFSSRDELLALKAKIADGVKS